MTAKQQYNYEYLQQFCQENGICLLKDYSNEKINRDAIIKGKCKTDKCCETFCKGFRQLTISGGFCKGCTELNRQRKVDLTNLINYGCKNVFQSEEVKNKIKETNVERYGDTCALRNPLIKEKQQNTNIERYGDTCALRNPLIKEKQQNTNIERYGNICSAQGIITQDKIKKSNLKNHGVEYTFQSEEVKNKIKETNVERYGDTCALRNPSIKEKQQNTIIEKYGVKYTFQSEEVKNKIKETNVERYGDTCALRNPLIKEKQQNTNIERYGGISPICSSHVKDKGKATSVINYGVEYPMQNAEYSEMVSKNSYHSKEYIFPSGKSIQIQGYENYMLDELLQKENILEEDIITSKIQVPTIWYLDDIGKKHRYYVDVFIPSQNRMIECKSTWTMKKGIEKDNIYLKQQACKDAGYFCEIWVYNSKGEKVECIL